MDGWKILKCHNCNSDELYYERGEVSAEERICDSCSYLRTAINYDDIDKADHILEIIGAELENANWHSACEIPYELYNEITGGKDDLELARKIAKVFYKNI
ncbi:hypothetical protein ACQKNX_07945 [Lysinibacillus sp. NPDC093712]|uniref:hypothetical protein n=1 Tax=Lysinibacillus sp. NPDC093712 TaxID=3390579 RepID=UPI003D0735BA